MSSLGNGYITKGYRSAAFHLLVVLLLSSVCNTYNTEYNCFLFSILDQLRYKLACYCR